MDPDIAKQIISSASLILAGAIGAGLTAWFGHRRFRAEAVVAQRRWTDDKTHEIAESRRQEKMKAYASFISATREKTQVLIRHSLVNWSDIDEDLEFFRIQRAQGEAMSTTLLLGEQSVFNRMVQVTGAQVAIITYCENNRSQNCGPTSPGAKELWETLSAKETDAELAMRESLKIQPVG
jgi:hypothetical protein